MSEERRYSPEEIDEIFSRAAQVPDTHGGSLPAGDGFTLAELQQIGEEVDLSPTAIAEAAAALDSPMSAPIRQTQLGLPIRVGKVVDLPRAPTDREWDQLVAELRHTFEARGKVYSDAGLREWRNGNLHAAIEPTATGYRLRLGTRKGSALVANRLALGAAAIGLINIVAFILAGDPQEGLFFAMTFWGIAAWFLGSSVFTLPRWAREREEQMEQIADRAVALLAGREGEQAL